MGEIFIDILINMAGAFFGFGLALWLQKNTERTNQKKTIQLIITSLFDELNDIERSLSEYKILDQVLHYRISIPAWEALINSGKILDLIDNPIYSKIIRVYSEINYFNESLNKSIDSELKKSCNEIILQIGSLPEDETIIIP